MKREFRLTRSTDFKRVRRSGKSYAHPLVVLVVHPAAGDGLRIGIAAGRSVGGAVERNRAKRRLRALLQELQPNIQPGWDVVILAREPINTADSPQLRTAVLQLLRRAGLINHTGE